jgi:hypothetical protein
MLHQTVFVQISSFSTSTVLLFTFRSVIHFELTFVIYSVCRFIIFACGCRVVPAPFIKKTVFPSLCYFYSFVKDQLTVFMLVYFWALHSVPLIYLSILLPIPHCFDYHNFIASLKVKWCQSSFFFQY